MTYRTIQILRLIDSEHWPSVFHDTSLVLRGIDTRKIQHKFCLVTLKKAPVAIALQYSKTITRNQDLVTCGATIDDQAAEICVRFRISFA